MLARFCSIVVATGAIFGCAAGIDPGRLEGEDAGESERSTPASRRDTAPNDTSAVIVSAADAGRGTDATTGPSDASAPDEGENGDAGPTLVAPPRFSHAGGFHTAAFNLALTAEPGAEIRFSTSGSEPVAASRLYEGWWSPPSRVSSRVLPTGFARRCFPRGVQGTL